MRTPAVRIPCKADLCRVRKAFVEQLGRERYELSAAGLEWIKPILCHPERKVRTPAHTKHLRWYVEFESQVTHRRPACAIPLVQVVVQSGHRLGTAGRTHGCIVL